MLIYSPGALQSQSEPFTVQASHKNLITRSKQYQGMYFQIVVIDGTKLVLIIRYCWQNYTTISNTDLYLSYLFRSKQRFSGIQYFISFRQTRNTLLAFWLCSQYKYVCISQY